MVITWELVGTFHGQSLPCMYLGRLVSLKVGISFDPGSVPGTDRNHKKRHFPYGVPAYFWTCLAIPPIGNRRTNNCCAKLGSRYREPRNWSLTGELVGFRSGHLSPGTWLRSGCQTSHKLNIRLINMTTALSRNVLHQSHSDVSSYSSKSKILTTNTVYLMAPRPTC